MSNEGLQTPTPVLQVVEGPGHLPTTSTTARRAPIERSKHPGCGIVGGIAGYQLMKDGDSIAKIGGYLLGAAVVRAACNGVDAMVEAAKGR